MRFSNRAVAVGLVALVAAGARGGVVITEIMYNPAGPDGVTPPAATGEWVEICNNGTQAVDISGWRLDDEDATDWGPLPAGATLAPGEVAVIASNPAEFNQAWGSNVKTFGVQWALLANAASSTNEVLALLDSNGAQVDVANYETGTNGWPPSVNGLSIHLKDIGADNNIGTNWALSAAGQNGAFQPSVGLSPYDAADTASPGYVANLVPLHPAQGATIAPGAASLVVHAFASGADPVTVKFFGRSFQAPPPPPFRIVALPDTQYYSQTCPANLRCANAVDCGSSRRHERRLRGP